VALAPPLPEVDFEAMAAEDVLRWAYAEYGVRLCLTCSWQKQSSVLVHMVSELGLPIDVIELDTAETALCLGIDEQNVRVRLHRARQAVAARMGGDSNLTEVWRFDGERCARVLAHVMAKLAAM